MASRSHIPLKEQLAAALRQMAGDDGKPVIPHDHAKLMTAEQVISLFHRDHYPIRKEDGGPDLHWNLFWRFAAGHRFKTATVDIPASAKGKRIRKTEAAHADKRLILSAHQTGERLAEQLYPLARPKPTRAIPSRPFQKQHRPLRGRNNLARRKDARTDRR